MTSTYTTVKTHYNSHESNPLRPGRSACRDAEYDPGLHIGCTRLHTLLRGISSRRINMSLSLQVVLHQFLKKFMATLCGRWSFVKDRQAFGCQSLIACRHDMYKKYHFVNGLEVCDSDYDFFARNKHSLCYGRQSCHLSYPPYYLITSSLSSCVSSKQ